MKRRTYNLLKAAEVIDILAHDHGGSTPLRLNTEVVGTNPFGSSRFAKTTELADGIFPGGNPNAARAELYSTDPRFSTLSADALQDGKGNIHSVTTKDAPAGPSQRVKATGGKKSLRAKVDKRLLNAGIGTVETVGIFPADERYVKSPANALALGGRMSQINSVAPGVTSQVEHLAPGVNSIAETIVPGKRKMRARVIDAGFLPAGESRMASILQLLRKHPKKSIAAALATLSSGGYLGYRALKRKPEPIIVEEPEPKTNYLPWLIGGGTAAALGLGALALRHRNRD